MAQSRAILDKVFSNRVCRIGVLTAVLFVAGGKCFAQVAKDPLPVLVLEQKPDADCKRKPGPLGYTFSGDACLSGMGSESASLLEPQIIDRTLNAPAVVAPLPFNSGSRLTNYYTPVVVEAKVPKKRKGFLSRLLAPLFDPVTESLDSASLGLEQTAEKIGDLSVPISNLVRPLEGLQDPMYGLQKPLADLRQPMIDLGQPMYGLREPIHNLAEPMRSLGQSAGSLGAPMDRLGADMSRLRQPLNGMVAPLYGMQQPLRGLVEPMRSLPGPLNGLVAPLNGLQRPLTGVSGSLHGLQTEMHDLRSRIERLYDAIVDIGRNVTLAIVFGSSVIAYAIWTHRKVPSVVEPTIATVETVPAGLGNGEFAPADHERTIIKTESVNHAHMHTAADTARWEKTHGSEPAQGGVHEEHPPHKPPPGAPPPPGE